MPSEIKFLLNNFFFIDYLRQVNFYNLIILNYHQKLSSIRKKKGQYVSIKNEICNFLKIYKFNTKKKFFKKLTFYILLFFCN